MREQYKKIVNGEWISIELRDITKGDIIRVSSGRTYVADGDAFWYDEEKCYGITAKPLS